MKTKRSIVTAFFIIIGASFILYLLLWNDGDMGSNPLVATSTVDTVATTTNSDQTFVGTEEIRIANLIPNQTVSNPFTITGVARGWYFEASFPVRLVDANGVTLWEGPAQAQSDWMTSEFVPFKVTLSYKTPTTKTGSLIFMKDNPSGLPEYDKSFTLPVAFTQATTTVSLYYYNSALDQDAQGNILCSSKGLVKVERTIPKTSTPLIDTLNLYLKGSLTEAEKASGITTEFPLPLVSLSSASISSTGVLTLSISDPNQKLTGGACRVSILRKGLEATALQFPTIKSITYTTPVFEP